MSQTPDEIRSDIERTRGHLGADVDALADKVSPASIAHRQSTRVRQSLRGVKDAVMGSAQDAGSTTRSAAHDLGSSVQEAPDRLTARTKGNPVAAGLIAFGVGLLVSSLIPPSEKEKDLASSLVERAEPLTSEISDAAREIVEQLKEPVEHAVQSVRETAVGSVETIKSETIDAATDIKKQGQTARDHLTQ
ncbi:DUF3618 domain-containing protein [Paeniglutamicibacter cryotolerans]|uniref:Gas vesicle protein n=1 Tax=Paeniglutamicibacter cryotolerans TaxID=670079 RepID=A0A839QNV9_9MICC|nr:DUF3618 domain-containing protein [Paeniglutamicibacter cryotolerans]MBB2997607.1 gas vesicle protein [Paeniglutamicibacter cryotolerans]